MIFSKIMIFENHDFVLTLFSKNNDLNIMIFEKNIIYSKIIMIGKIMIFENKIILLFFFKNHDFLKTRS